MALFTRFNAAELVDFDAPRQVPVKGYRGIVGMSASGKLSVECTERSDTRLVLQLLEQALLLLGEDRPAAERRVEDAIALLSATAETERPRRRMLAEWQVRRAEEFIRIHLGSCLRIQDVARAVNLSTSYFSRAFKRTSGVSYSDYVTKERLDLAKRLLLTSDSPISEIALVCGLADQSHLTRLFSRTEGLPPRAWRRMLREGVQQSDLSMLSRQSKTSRLRAAADSGASPG
jgi:AraC family transcriptional regulator